MMTGAYKIFHWRRGKIINRIAFKNLIPNEGSLFAANVLFGGTPKTNFFIGLIDGPLSAGAIVAADSMASHAGWTENTGYDQATRRAWTASLVSGSEWANTANLATFNFSSPASVQGAFLTTNNVKGGTAGALMSAARNSIALSMIADDTLTVLYDVQIA